MYKFRLTFHWRSLLRVQSTISQHWFRWWSATSHFLNQWWLVYWRIYTPLGINDLLHWQTLHMLLIARAKWRPYTTVVCMCRIDISHETYRHKHCHLFETDQMFSNMFYAQTMHGLHLQSLKNVMIYYVVCVAEIIKSFPICIWYLLVTTYQIHIYHLLKYRL